MDRKLLNYTLSILAISLSLFLLVYIIREVIYLSDYTKMSIGQKIVTRGGEIR